MPLLFLFQPDQTVRGVFEFPQSRQVGLLAASQAEEYLVYRAVQAVRALSLGHASPASHPFCDIRLLHSGLTVAGEYSELGGLKSGNARIPLTTWNFPGEKKLGIGVNATDELILIAD